MVASTCNNACELKNKHCRALTAASGALVFAAQTLAVLLVIASADVFASARGAGDFTSASAAGGFASAGQDAPGTAAAPDDHADAEEHHSVWAGLFWPTVNFAILFGGLYYLLATPLTNYLQDRHTAIRKELVEAASLSAAASAQIAELDRKLRALPGEIAALRQRGAEEIAAEEARIAAVAAAERERLLEQTRREIDLQLRLARRELVEHTADLAVQLAAGRIDQQITPADQDHLVDRYLHNVSGERTEGAR